MKVALITTNLAGGGAERVFLRWAELLAARGHDTHLVLLEHRIQHAVEGGIRLHALTAPGRACRKGALGKILTAWRLRALLRELARGRPFDLHISTLPFADEVARRARLPRLWHRVANTLSAEVDRLEGRKAARRRSRYRRLYRDANLVAVSDGVAADLRDNIAPEAARIVRIYNAYDFAGIRALAARPCESIPAEPYVIHVGRFAPQKRHDLLLDAFRRAHPSERLVLLCDRDARLAGMIGQAGLSGRVTVAGFQRNPYPWIRQARLLVLCSDHEGLPNVLIEALACGTPVVSTDCPSGPREVLTGALTRWLVPCGDAERLARAMRERLSEARAVGDADLSRFDAASVVGQIESLAER